MTLKFYYAPMSSASITKTVLAELQVDYEEILMDLSKGDTRKPEHLKINPNGKVPVIVHDGNPVWESAAITLYLGEVFGVEKGLYPPPGIQRGNAMKWTVWGSVTFMPAASKVHEAMQNKDKPEMMKAAKKGIEDCLKVLEGGLQGKDYILGEKFSVVDAHLQSLVGWVKMMEVSLDDFPQTAKWLKACEERPAIAALEG